MVIDFKEVKKALVQQLQDLIEKRIDTAHEALLMAGEARNNETKSSAGDKHETGRAMMQQEEDNIRGQLGQHQRLKSVLEQLNILKIYDEVLPGCLVVTSSGNYFLAIGMGKLMVGSEPWFCISSGSPIGKILLHKKTGETVQFQGRNIKILELG